MELKVWKHKINEWMRWSTIRARCHTLSHPPTPCAPIFPCKSPRQVFTQYSFRTRDPQPNSHNSSQRRASGVQLLCSLIRHNPAARSPHITPSAIYSFNALAAPVPEVGHARARRKWMRKSHNRVRNTPPPRRGGSCKLCTRSGLEQAPTVPWH